MNYDGFLDVVRALNKESYSFGNETLYKMANSPNDIKDREKLAGAIWIIGRAYAASPQRRSYGKKWVVKTSNDGREGFFDYIAENIDLDWLNNMPTMPTSQVQFGYDGSDKDMDLLAKSIAGVLGFNLALSEAIGKFDETEKAAAKNVYCSNHISFCSKFLHFYFPHSVFIIDSYAFDGAKSLFNGKANDAKKWRYICNPNDTSSYCPLTVQNAWKKYAFDETVYVEICGANDIINKMKKNNIYGIIEKYTNQNTAEGFGANDYIEHCARSYCLAKKLKESNITPETQIKNENFAPMTRLTDTVFLNIKREMSKSEKEKLAKKEEEKKKLM